MPCAVVVVVRICLLQEGGSPVLANVQIVTLLEEGGVQVLAHVKMRTFPCVAFANAQLGGSSKYSNENFED